MTAYPVPSTDPVGQTERLAQLREPFPPAAIGKLPRKIKDRDGKVTGTIHLDYVGHAAVTARLLTVDPGWSWEPVAWADDGTPLIKVRGSEASLWVRLTVCGVTRLGVGTCAADGFDVPKQLIGDALRNAAMRFGVALDLWSREEIEHPDPAPPPPDPKVVAQLVVKAAAKVAARPDMTDEDVRASARDAWERADDGSEDWAAIAASACDILAEVGGSPLGDHPKVVAKRAVVAAAQAAARKAADEGGPEMTDDQVATWAGLVWARASEGETDGDWERIGSMACAVLAGEIGFRDGPDFRAVAMSIDDPSPAAAGSSPLDGLEEPPRASDADRGDQ